VASIVALPLVLPGWLPLTDLGEYAAAMGPIARFGDPSFRIDEHYTVAWTTSQYLLAHLAGAALVLLTGSAAASAKILLVALAFGWVEASRRLFRALGSDERLAIPAALLFWNRALGLGFLPYVASLPLLLATLASFFVGLERGLGRARLGGLALAGVVVFYTHASAFTLLGALAGAAALIVEGTWRQKLTRLAWLVPAGVLAFVWVVRGRFAVPGAGLHGADEIARMNALRAIKVAAIWAHDVWTSHVDELVGIAFWVSFLGLLARQQRFERRGLVLFLVAMAVYLATPFRVGAGVLLNVRMAPVVALFALAALRPKPGRWTDLAFVATAALALVQGFDNVRNVRRLQADVAGLPELLARIPRGSRLVTLNFSGMDPDRAHAPPWIYAASYHRAEAGGVASFSFSELPHWSVQYRSQTAPPKQDAISWAMAPCLYRNARDGAYFDYVLVRGAVDPFRAEPRGPVFRVLGKTPKYTLWEKTGEVRSSGADEGPCVAGGPK